jgi:DNA-binding SARP family transcriptional activator
MGRLSLALLGVPAVHHAGRTVAFATRKALALLVYLAVEGEAQPREKLTALFWPESPPARGRAALRKTLAYLQRALNDGSAPHVRADRDSLAIDPESDVNVDLQALARAAQAGRSAALAVEQALETLQAAARLYRGDFLEGFSLSDAPEFDNWASLRRETCHRQATLVFDRLSQIQFERGQAASALETTARWAAHDPLNEAAHRRLMQLHFAAGDRAAALQAYETCCETLRREVNAEPAPATRQLAERIRADRQPPAQPTQLERAGSGTLEAALVGRAAEHLRLVEAFRAARRGQVRVVTLEGEPGIGKTRLAREFSAWAGAQGAEVLWGGALDIGAPLAYQAIVPALRGRLQIEADPRRLLGVVWLAELSRLLPELAERVPGLPPPLQLGEADSRARLFEAAARVVQTLAEATPVVLFVDDLQWADECSLEWLQYAAHRWAGSDRPVLLVLTIRSDDLATSPPLAHWLSALGHDLPVTRVDLESLTLDETREMIASFGLFPEREQAEQEFGRALFEETRGQPFFIVQTLRALAERNEASRRASLPHVLAGSVRELILGRLARLSTDAHALCAAGAVLGDGFEFGLAARVADLAEAQGLPALEELLARGLVREANGARGAPGGLQPGGLYFGHDQIREVTYGELSAARRSLLHRRAFEALEAASASAARLARHALAAGLAEPAFRYSLAAGDEALRLFAVGEALRHYEHAQEIAGSAAGARLDSRTLYQLHFALSRGHELAVHGEKARAAGEVMLRLARELDDAQLECEALNRLATLVAFQGHMSDLAAALRLLESALEIAAQQGDKAGLAATEWNLALMGVYGMDVQAAVEHGQRALALARELGSADKIARCLNQITLAELFRGRWTEAEAYASEASSLYAELGNRAMEVDSLCLLSNALRSYGRPHEAVTIGRRASAISLEIENPWGTANAASELGRALTETGEYGEALRVAQSGVEVARAVTFPALLLFNLVALGDVYRAMFALPAALEAHGEAATISADTNLPQFGREVTSALCADYAAAGDWEQARLWAERRFESRRDIHTHIGMTVWNEAEALLRAGEDERAIEEVGDFGQRYQDTPRYRLGYLRALAVLDLYPRDGPPSAAARQSGLEHLRQAAALAEEIGLPGELWQIDAKLGEAYLANGDETEAQRCFGRAADTVRSLAATIDDPGLRAGFLAAEPVQRLLAATGEAEV